MHYDYPRFSAVIYRIFFIPYLMSLIVASFIYSSILYASNEESDEVLGVIKTSIKGERIILEDSPYIKLEKERLIPGIIREVEILQAHEEDYIDIFQDTLTPQLLGSIRKNIEGNQKILELLQGLKNGKLNENDAIKEILLLRYSLIKSRRSNALLYNQYLLKGSKDLEILYGPTDPDIYDSLTPSQKFLASKATDKYQIFNRVIIGIASLADMRKLSPEVKRLLRASPLICSLLENKSRDFGHPDETFILSQKAHEKKMSDWEYFATHIMPSEQIMITNFSSFYREDIMIRVPPYERKIFDPSWEHPFASIELPYPEFLRPYSLIQKIPSVDVKASFEKQAPALSKMDTPVEIDSVKIVKKSLAEESTFTNSINTPLELTVNVMPDQNSQTAAEVRNLPPELGEVARPRGMRKFHNYLPEIQSSKILLKGKHLKVYEDLIDIKTFVTVKYKDFAGLWRYINGSNSIPECRGGSHKKLLNAQGDTITGIYAHGDNQTFGKRTIKYIRDAFKQIGYTQEK